ncbi:hypothetical protein [Actinosynnema mirum]|uniref:Integral membrane protein n=1 Tax=Actinosynnema mirum (strain ATCC 29888 / DSM 43827 / JCM 3225 / NBRC 14064 / NCIMB 13271 / NRRL B-12336 / IMRU 3971 / 101) TaxID=446462 RepID=C6WIC4_ACTMD|nr:hypothetical protein [Actinosynnema mirum]ACU36167.1 conserved hypothetical protein [Actinosynnema mirum DSM 43827]
MEPLVLVIVACEVGFWVVLAAGLLLRYAFRLRRAGAVLLACAPLLDVVLLAAAVLDLARGGQATGAHGLAALYLGVSVAFGHSMLRWADQRFAHWFAGGPPPVKPPEEGPERVAHEWREWGKAVLAGVVAAAVVGVLALAAGGLDRVGSLLDSLRLLAAVCGVWLVTGPVWSSAKLLARR